MTANERFNPAAADLSQRLESASTQPWMALDPRRLMSGNRPLQGLGFSVSDIRRNLNRPLDENVFESGEAAIVSSGG